MTTKNDEILKTKCSAESLKKLHQLNNQKLFSFITEYAALCNPDSIYVCDNSDNDRDYITAQSLKNKEEIALAVKGHTIHFDGYNDQARDKANTKYLVSKGHSAGAALNTVDKKTGTDEVHSFLKNSMVGKEMYVLFFCLGPTNSVFSIPCAQITDSAYVAHSEYILYRKGYEQFKKIGNADTFFRYVHSAGTLENQVSKIIAERRVYVDLEDNIVFSTNTQYAGNTVGLKKLSLRLAIQKAAQEGWLAEHMLVMGIHGPKGRKTYFSGAFPSACGKTSTAMLPGETIIGDDIAYLRKKDGKIYAANVESGIFGIIRDVNSKDDPVIWNSLTNPGEVIFSNILITEDKTPRWLGDNRPAPEKGINYSGDWNKDKKDAKGNPISFAHKNARYTVSLHSLKNTDSELDNKDGVEIKGIIYGGRDSSILPPIQESFDWIHGVITIAASLESETTAATLGKEGVRQFNPMSNLDFISIPLGTYIDNYCKFIDDIKTQPVIFAVNYFQKDKDGNYMTSMQDKRIWVKWMELRVNKDVSAIQTPTGFIPIYDDLKKLFKEVLNKEYSKDNYIDQFTVRVDENLSKIERIKEIYKTKAKQMPEVFDKIFSEQKKRLEAAQSEFGAMILPDQLQKESVK